LTPINKEKRCLVLFGAQEMTLDIQKQLSSPEGKGKKMSSLTDVEKRYLEKLIGMQCGHVLD